MKKLLTLLAFSLLSVKIFAQCGMTVSHTVNYPTTCGGNDGSITTAISGGVSPFTYTWNNAQTTQNISGLTVGQYILTITDATSCQHTDTVDMVGLVTNPLTASTNSPVCENSQLWLNANTGMANYKWYNGDTSQLASQSAFSDGGAYSVYVTAGMNNNGETLTVVVTDMTGCKDTASVVATVNPLPVMSASSNSPICFGTSLSLFGGPGGMVTYQWLGPNGFVSGFQGPSISNITMANSGVYTFSVTDANDCVGTATTTVIVNPLPISAPTSNSPVCIGADLMLSSGASGMASYFWYGGQGLTSNLQNPIFINAGPVVVGHYGLQVTDMNGCTDSAGINVSVINDCVYPGDANYDMVADNNDVLNIGLAYGATGAARNNATTAWQGQAAVDWVQQFTNGVNYKQADCDGNGIVEAADTLAIQLNYGDTHQKTSTVSSSGPPLAVHFPSGNFQTGTSITAPITLGDGTTPANNVYGVAFTVNYSSNVLNNNQINISFNNNWIGSNILTLYHNSPADNSIHVAISRIDHTPISGNGQICALEGVTIGNVAGKDETIGLEYFTITNVRLIDNLGTDIPFDIENDSVMVTPMGIKDQKIQVNAIKMFPNPANDVLYIMSDVTVKKIEIRDVSGKVVRTEMPSKGNKIKLDISTLDSSVYIVSCEDENGNMHYTKVMKQ